MAPSAEDYKLRQLILDEWRAKRTTAQALKNIQGKMGQTAAVTSSKVSYWYKRFDKGDTSIFNKGSSMHLSIQGNSNAGGTKDPANSVLFTSNEKKLNGMRTQDGRFVIFPKHVIDKKPSIVFYDLFHGVSKKIPSPFDKYDSVYMLGDFLLKWEDYNKFSITKIDYETLTLGTSKQITWEADENFIGYGSEPLIDQLDSNRFVILGGQKVVIGQLERDNIVLGNTGDMPKQQTHFVGERLMGDKLQGFMFQQRGDYSSLKFCEINLETMQRTQMDAPLLLDGIGTDDFDDVVDCSWSNSRCYTIARFKKAEDRVWSFNPQTCVWSDIHITAKNTTGMFVDSDDMLTLKVSLKNGKSTFYRFANKKPDSLKNLAWFAILRSSKLFGSDIYRQIAHLLPYTCDLRCYIPDETAEEPQAEGSG